MSPRSGRRVGNTRMDAALDFVAQMGYPREQVRAKMVDLLKEYGGEVGYPFIEADAYKVLMDAILEEEESKREKASIKSPKNTGEPSASIESACSHTPNTAQIHRGVGNRWKDIGLDKIRSPEKRKDNNSDGFSADTEAMYSPIPPGWAPPPPPPPPLISAASPPPPPPRRRNPCYGWISDDEDGEEETEFVILTPMELRSPGGTVIRSPTRRSRWDLRPEDM